MSTKIFNAYQFLGDADHLMQRLRAYRLQWQDFQIARLKQMEPLEFTKLRAAIVKQSTKQFKSFADVYDVSGSVAIYFVGKKIFCQTFLQSSGTPPKLIDHQFQDYHYQDQSDEWYELDSTLSKEQKKQAAIEWKQRKEVWDKIFDANFSSPIESGLAYELVSRLEMQHIAIQVLKGTKE